MVTVVTPDSRTRSAGLIDHSYVNRTGVTLAVGDVVVLDTSTDDGVVLASTYGDIGPLVVTLGGVNGATIRCATVGRVSVLMETAGQVDRGDIIVSSATSKYGHVDNAVTDGRKIIGIARSAKAAATSGSVRVMIGSAGAAAATGIAEFNVLSYGAMGDAVDGNDSYIDLSDGQYLDQGAVITVRDGLVVRTIGINKGVTVNGVDAQMMSSNAHTPAQSVAAFLTAYNGLTGWTGIATADPNRTGAASGQRDRAYMRSPNFVDAAQSHTNSNGAALIISNMKKGALWSGTDDTAAFNACWAALVANGRGRFVVPSMLPDGSDARYRINGNVAFTAAAPGTQDIAATLDFGQALIILDQGFFTIGGDIGRLRWIDATIRGRSHWSEDGTYAVKVSGFSNLAAYELHGIRFIGWTDGPSSGVTAKPGACLWVEGDVQLRDIMSYGCGGARGVTTAHNIHTMQYNNVIHYDSGVLDGENYEKNARAKGWFTFGNGANGAESGTDSGNILLVNCRHDENYAADVTTLTGGYTFDPGLLYPGGVAAYDSAARYRHVELVNCPARMCINAGTYGVGLFVKQADALTIRGLQDYRQAGLSQHLLAIQDCGDTVIRGSYGTLATQGDRITFVGSLNKSYTEEGTTHAGWFLDSGSGGTLPLYTRILKGGYDAILVVSDAALEQYTTCVQSASTDKRVTQSTTGTVGSQVRGVILDTASGSAQIVRMVPAGSGKMATLKKQGAGAVTRGDRIIPGATTAGYGVTAASGAFIGIALTTQSGGAGATFDIQMTGGYA